MEIVLIPGFWLDGSSWDDVTPSLQAAGHHARPMTLPGLESREADRSGIGLHDHAAAVVDVIDSVAEPVLLVGHSGGGVIAQAVVDARPDRIARVAYVGALPLGHGAAINDHLRETNGEIPLPEWSVFDPEDLVDLDDALRERFRAMAVPEPAGVARDLQVLSDERRHDVPVTVIACGFTTDLLRE